MAALSGGKTGAAQNDQRQTPQAGCHPESTLVRVMSFAGDK